MPMAKNVLKTDIRIESKAVGCVVKYVLSLLCVFKCVGKRGSWKMKSCRLKVPVKCWVIRDYEKSIWRFVIHDKDRILIWFDLNLNGQSRVNSLVTLKRADIRGSFRTTDWIKKIKWSKVQNRLETLEKFAKRKAEKASFIMHGFRFWIIHTTLRESAREMILPSWNVRNVREYPWWWVTKRKENEIIRISRAKTLPAFWIFNLLNSYNIKYCFWCKQWGLFADWSRWVDETSLAKMSLDDSRH